MNVDFIPSFIPERNCDPSLHDLESTFHSGSSVRSGMKNGRTQSGTSCTSIRKHAQTPPHSKMYFQTYFASRSIKLESFASDLQHSRRCFIRYTQPLPSAQVVCISDKNTAAQCCMYELWALAQKRAINDIFTRGAAESEGKKNMYPSSRFIANLYHGLRCFPNI